MLACSYVVEPTQTFQDAIAQGGGNFTEVEESLLPLFDERGGSRRWREIFGLERPRPRRGDKSFTDREVR